MRGVINPGLYRMYEEARWRREYAGPYKPSLDVILISADPSEFTRRQAQVLYYLEKRAETAGFSSSYVECKVVYASQDPQQWPALTRQFWESYNLRNIYVVAHGDRYRRGRVVTAPGWSSAWIEDLVPKQPGEDIYGFSRQHIHCYAHNAPSLQMDQAFYRRIMLGLDSVATSPGLSSEVTWNVPRILVDGRHGEVHTGLNPEVLRLPLVQHWVRQGGPPLHRFMPSMA